MDVREKLVDIVCDPAQINGCIHRCNHPPCAMVGDIVDALIANGVTVQEWISVEDRLPEKDGAYLAALKHFGKYSGIYIRYFTIDGDKVDEYELAGKKYVWYFYDSEYGCVTTNFVTHWMPLPLPPKGE